MKLFTGARWSQSHTNNGFFKLVKALLHIYAASMVCLRQHRGQKVFNRGGFVVLWRNFGFCGVAWHSKNWQKLHWQNNACRQIFVLATLLHSVLLKLCIMNAFLHFLLCQSCCSLRNASLGGPHIPRVGLIDLIKMSYDGWLSISTSSDGPPFKASLWPPNPKSTTILMLLFTQYKTIRGLLLSALSLSRCITFQDVCVQQSLSGLPFSDLK